MILIAAAIFAVRVGRLDVDDPVGLLSASSVRSRESRAVISQFPRQAPVDTGHDLFLI